MSATKPNDAEIIRRALEARLADVWTSTPGRVEKYDAVTRTADVSPVVRRPITTTEDDTTHETLPVIPNVQVMFPCSGAASITWPILPGDHVMLLIQTLSIQQWRQTGQTSEPGDLRLHCLGNAVAIPGFSGSFWDRPLPAAEIAALVLDHATDIRLGVAATQYVALANLVAAELTRIKDAIAAGVPVAGDGGVALQSTILAALDLPAPFPASVAALKVKAE